MNGVLNVTDLAIVSKVNSNSCAIIYIAESYNKEMFEHSFIVILFADTLKVAWNTLLLFQNEHFL